MRKLLLIIFIVFIADIGTSLTEVSAKISDIFRGRKNSESSRNLENQLKLSNQVDASAKALISGVQRIIIKEIMSENNIGVLSAYENSLVNVEQCIDNMNRHLTKLRDNMALANGQGRKSTDKATAKVDASNEAMKNILTNFIYSLHSNVTAVICTINILLEELTATGECTIPSGELDSLIKTNTKFKQTLSSLDAEIDGNLANILSTCANDCGYDGDTSHIDKVCNEIKICVKFALEMSKFVEQYLKQPENGINKTEISSAKDRFNVDILGQTRRSDSYAESAPNGDSFRGNSSQDTYEEDEPSSGVGRRYNTRR